MPLVGLDACKRTLRVKRALYKRGVGDLRDLMRKRSKCIKKSRGQVRKLEDKVQELGGTLSEDVSDYSSVLCGTSSDSESDTESDKNEVAQKKPEDKPSPKKIVAAGTNKTDAAPPSEAKSEGNQTEVKAVGRRSKQTFPEIPPGEYAPLHKGKPNAQGVLYPGLPKGDPMRCDPCEQFRRGFTRSGKAHKPQCPWKVRG